MVSNLFAVFLILFLIFIVATVINHHQSSRPASFIWLEACIVSFKLFQHDVYSIVSYCCIKFQWLWAWSSSLLSWAIWRSTFVLLNRIRSARRYPSFLLPSAFLRSVGQIFNLCDYSYICAFCFQQSFFFLLVCVALVCNLNVVTLDDSQCSHKTDGTSSSQSNFAPTLHHSPMFTTWFEWLSLKLFPELSQMKKGFCPFEWGLISKSVCFLNPSFLLTSVLLHLVGQIFNQLLNLCSYSYICALGLQQSFSFLLVCIPLVCNLNVMVLVDGSQGIHNTDGTSSSHTNFAHTLRRSPMFPGCFFKLHTPLALNSSAGACICMQHSTILPRLGHNIMDFYASTNHWGIKWLLVASSPIIGIWTKPFGGEPKTS